jgi:hypothetical protein
MNPPRPEQPFRLYELPFIRGLARSSRPWPPSRCAGCFLLKILAIINFLVSDCFLAQRLRFHWPERKFWVAGTGREDIDVTRRPESWTWGTIRRGMICLTIPSGPVQREVEHVVEVASHFDKVADDSRK